MAIFARATLVHIHVTIANFPARARMTCNFHSRAKNWQHGELCNIAEGEQATGAEREHFVTTGLPVMNDNPQS